ncbi:I78 family peptidase inhibitor [Qipengyuania gelatinilytica]|uniref:I78 family peptidase inhibitor n=1 Tax=Qipengyuania gelatinilytica TaxID=2867231 RepID=UPI001FFC82BB|nr:I78 family peptidase inhibitor [Qipengyuania gelatinilytica]
MDASDLDGDGACQAAPAQTLLHQAASDELAEAILKASGARTLRWGGPDTVFTMDYREDRVNVIYDADGTITRITCG